MSHALLLAVCSVTTLAASNRVADEAAIRQRLAIYTEARAFSLTVDGMRFLDSRVAIADMHIVAGPPELKIDMLGPYVLVKHDGAWPIGAARIARTQAP
ncbi:MAG: hypothetical protein ABSH31_15055 [Bryobacteraceae bacterium]